MVYLYIYMCVFILVILSLYHALLWFIVKGLPLFLVKDGHPSS